MLHRKKRKEDKKYIYIMIADSLSSSSEESPPPSPTIPRAVTSTRTTKPLAASHTRRRLSKENLKLSYGILPSVPQPSPTRTPPPDKQPPSRGAVKTAPRPPPTTTTPVLSIPTTPINSSPDNLKETSKTSSLPQPSRPPPTNSSPDLLKETSKWSSSSQRSRLLPPPPRSSSPDLLKETSKLSPSTTQPSRLQPPPRRVHKPSLMLSEEENRDVFRLIGIKCQSLATAKVELFVSKDPDGNNWERQDQGVACFVRDSKYRSYYIRVFSLQENAMLWEMEIKPTFNCQLLGPCFHAFQIGDCNTGLNFTDDTEANNFKSTIEEKLKQIKERRQNYKEGVVASLPTNSKEFTPTISKERKRQIRKEDIGLPIDFQLLTHVGHPSQRDSNFLKDLESNTLDPKVEHFLLECGVTKDHLKERQTREFIIDFILKQSKNEEALGESSSNDVQFPKTPPPDTTCKTPTTPNMQMTTHSVCLTNSAGNIATVENISHTNPQKPQKPPRKSLPSDQKEIPRTVQQQTTQPVKPTPTPREYTSVPSTKTIQQTPTETNQFATIKSQQSTKEIKQSTPTMKTRPTSRETKQSIRIITPETASEETEQYTSTLTSQPALRETNQSTQKETPQPTPGKNNLSTLSMKPQPAPRKNNQSTSTKTSQPAPIKNIQPTMKVTPQPASSEINQSTLIKTPQSTPKETDQFTQTMISRSLPREDNQSTPTRTSQPTPRIAHESIPIVAQQPAPSETNKSTPTETPQPTPKETNQFTQTISQSLPRENNQSTPTRTPQPTPRKTNASTPTVTPQPAPKETIQSTPTKTPQPTPRKLNQSNN